MLVSFPENTFLAMLPAAPIRIGTDDKWPRTTGLKQEAKPVNRSAVFLGFEAGMSNQKSNEPVLGKKKINKIIKRNNNN